MTNKKFIALNLIATVAGILILAFSNGIFSCGKTAGPELAESADSLQVSFGSRKDTVPVRQNGVYFLENNVLEGTSYVDAVYYCD